MKINKIKNSATTDLLIGAIVFVWTGSVLQHAQKVDAIVIINYALTLIGAFFLIRGIRKTMAGNKEDTKK